MGTPTSHFAHGNPIGMGTNIVQFGNGNLPQPCTLCCVAWSTDQASNCEVNCVTQTIILCVFNVSDVNSVESVHVVYENFCSLNYEL